MSLSIIIPTRGRPSLEKTLSSIWSQLEDGDEIQLIHDGPISFGTQYHLDRMWRSCNVTQLYDGPHEDWGAVARNEGLKRATGDHILFMDDDDCYTPDGLNTVRRAIAVDPQAIFLFQMRYGNGRVLWQEREIKLGNVSTQMFCFPGRFTYKPWESTLGHDFRFIDDVVRLNPGHTLLWVPEVIALIRP